MKKLLILLLLMISMFFCSCGNKTENTVVNDSIDSFIEDTILLDTLHKKGNVKLSITMSIDTIEISPVSNTKTIK